VKKEEPKPVIKAPEPKKVEPKPEPPKVVPKPVVVPVKKEEPVIAKPEVKKIGKINSNPFGNNEDTSRQTEPPRRGVKKDNPFAKKEEEEPVVAKPKPVV